MSTLLVHTTSLTSHRSIVWALHEVEFPFLLVELLFGVHKSVIQIVRRIPAVQVPQAIFRDSPAIACEPSQEMDHELSTSATKMEVVLLKTADEGVVADWVMCRLKITKFRAVLKYMESLVDFLSLPPGGFFLLTF